MEVNDHEYRFKDVIDMDTREVLFTEMRSQTPSAVWPAADQPQSGAEQPRLQAGPGQHVRDGSEPGAGH